MLEGTQRNVGWGLGNMATYRDPDSTALEVFKQHLAIAETLHETEVELSAKLNAYSGREECLAPLTAWDNMWAQLEQARGIAINWGRDVRAYEAARARSGARTVDPVLGVVLARQAREAAEDAIDALRAAFPEVVVPGRPRAPRPVDEPPPIHARRAGDGDAANATAVSPSEPGLTARGNDKIRTFVVSLRSAGYGDLSNDFARYSTHPAGNFGNRCVCCNAETERKFEYSPHTPSNLIAASIRVPRCNDCVTHVASISEIAGLLAAFAMIAAVVSIVLGFVEAPLLAVPGAGVILGIAIYQIRARRQEKALHGRGHYSRFGVGIGPKVFTLRTSNPQLADEFVKLNSRHQ